MDSATLALANNLSLWVGLVLSLMIFSAFIRDNGFSRLAQHILLGATLGYLALLALQHILRPRLFEPLLAGSQDWQHWTPFLLGALLLFAGLDRSLRSKQTNQQVQPAWRRGLHYLGRLPAVLLLGLSMGVGIAGLLQGTLIPQYWHAVRIAIPTTGPGLELLAGSLTLIITTGVWLHLFLGPERFLALQPTYLQRVLEAWTWLGQRALWFAAGLFFARLLASRLSLLLARLDYFVNTVAELLN
jgi:hypothetical protein